MSSLCASGKPAIRVVKGVPKGVETTAQANDNPGAHVNSVHPRLLHHLQDVVVGANPEPRLPGTL